MNTYTITTFHYPASKWSKEETWFRVYRKPDGKMVHRSKSEDKAKAYVKRKTEGAE